jgi:hypothetical protein
MDLCLGNIRLESGLRDTTADPERHELSTE